MYICIQTYVCMCVCMEKPLEGICQNTLLKCCMKFENCAFESGFICCFTIFWLYIPMIWCWVFRKLVDYFVPRTYRSVRALSTYIHMYKHLNWYIHSMSVGIVMCMCACGEFGWKLPIAASCFSVVCCPFRPTVQYLFSCGCTCVRIISLTNCATFPIRKKEWLLQFSIWTLSNLNKRMCMC